MGNHNSQTRSRTNSRQEHQIAVPTRSESTKAYTPCLEKLFQKLELTADNNNDHPGEITRITFEKAFHGPLHVFGKLLYNQMCDNSRKERITREQFIKSGKEIVQMFDETAQHKYYFRLFANGKDCLDKEGKLSLKCLHYNLFSHQKLNFLFKISHIFGIKDTLNFDSFSKWLAQHCPHMFSGVHNWVHQILTGSKMPSELETAPFPLLERFVEGKHCMSMGMLWALSATIPYQYTHSAKEDAAQQDTSSGFKNPLLTSYHLLMKLARLSGCQSWTLLYDSCEHGLSLNRFTHHISSYNGPTITLISFEGRNMYCVAEDKGWSEGPSRFGGEDTMIIQLTPAYRVVQAGGPMVLWNEHERSLPQGIKIGKDDKSAVLFIPSDFDKIQHYGVNCCLTRIEVWGCGGTEAKKAQQKQKQWERKDIEKHRGRKLKLETNWNENPDKQLLNWGGIQTDHQHSREGGF
ncbi:hypothetical protein ACJMK2_011003 [Sinanodonta woodiana]|uniref:TLDc domain-containing protein n=1 Tax=Sinanodonta woodiana TaxID=1069815 RepID=A0ABD3V4V4_SINWO